MPRFALLILFVVALAGCASEDAAPAQRVFFESPADGATVQSPFEVTMGAEGIAVAPAGTMEENTGHFHIVVNGPLVPAGAVIPADSLHLHYGTGAASATLDLPAGEHVLRLQMGDGAHMAIEGLSDQITVTVE
ncbi:MAG: DUF4399 domain-containing protein [Rhodothermales bacterium]|nr:DUF4399 domain-containing protein [Rhodothermales bacterium]